MIAMVLGSPKQKVLVAPGLNVVKGTSISRPFRKLRSTVENVCGAPKKILMPPWVKTLAPPLPSWRYFPRWLTLNISLFLRSIRHEHARRDTTGVQRLSTRPEWIRAGQYLEFKHCELLLSRLDRLRGITLLLCSYWATLMFSLCWDCNDSILPPA